MAQGDIKFVYLLMFAIVVLLGMETQVVLGETLMVRCKEKERKALLELKHGLIDEHDLLSSWGSEEHQKECCQWSGVRCSNTTGHVIALQLGNYNGQSFGGVISSSLVELHHLNDLDLSWNDFGMTRIPDFIGSIKTLQYLRIFYSNFSGRIPPQLGNLTQLRILDLGGNNNLWSDNLSWLSRLSLLSELYLGSANISDTSWVQHVLLNLPSLQTLSLNDCSLKDVAQVSATHHFLLNTSTSLSVLYLSNNELTSSIFDYRFFNVSASLVELDYSSNKLDGPIPDAFGSLSLLQSLSLSRNMFKGVIPTSFKNLSHLKRLDLEGNPLGVALEGFLRNLPCKEMVSLSLPYAQLTGALSAATLGQFSKLEDLDLSYNYLQGNISEAHFINLGNLYNLGLSFNSLTLELSPHWTPPFQLEKLRIASCKIGPSFPTWVRTQTSLLSLDLSSNDISGEVPKWFWSLWSSSYMVVYLNISHNQMSGSVPDLSSYWLDILDLSSNKFAGHLPLLHPNTSVAQLSQNQFSGSNISSFVCQLNNQFLWLLDLSDNKLEGTIPKCWENMTVLQILNLDDNNLSGEIPTALGSLSNLKTLHLRGNDLSGELPSSLKNCQLLQFIDIGGNKLSGTIPSWLGEHFSNMTYLSLRQNRFYGSIPVEICKLTQLQVLDLSGNNISGKIPHCFNNFTLLVDKDKTTTATVRIPISDNDFIDYILVQWKGQETEYKNTLGLLKLIDLSRNNLVGSIPRAFSDLKGLVSLNLSRNNLMGNMDPNIGEMEMLESLDLSTNLLSGEIPTSLAQLYFLNKLDLANNNLSGKIPLNCRVLMNLLLVGILCYVGNHSSCARRMILGHPSLMLQKKMRKKMKGFLAFRLCKNFVYQWRLVLLLDFGE